MEIGERPRSPWAPLGNPPYTSKEQRANTRADFVHKWYGQPSDVVKPRSSETWQNFIWRNDHARQARAWWQYSQSRDAYIGLEVDPEPDWNVDANANLWYDDMIPGRFHKLPQYGPPPSYMQPPPPNRPFAEWLDPSLRSSIQQLPPAPPGNMMSPEELMIRMASIPEPLIVSGGGGGPACRRQVPASCFAVVAS